MNYIWSIVVQEINTVLSEKKNKFTNKQTWSYNFWTQKTYLNRKANYLKLEEDKKKGKRDNWNARRNKLDKTKVNVLVK